MNKFYLRFNSTFCNGIVLSIAWTVILLYFIHNKDKCFFFKKSCTKSLLFYTGIVPNFVISPRWEKYPAGFKIKRLLKIILWVDQYWFLLHNFGLFSIFRLLLKQSIKETYLIKDRILNRHNPWYSFSTI